MSKRWGDGGTFLPGSARALTLSFGVLLTLATDQAAIAQILPTLTSLPADQPSTATTAYVDRVMEVAPAGEDAIDLKQSTYNESGWARGWRIESTSALQRGYGSSQNQSLAISGFLETPDYGIFSANANLTGASAATAGNATVSNSGSTLRIDQRGLALNGGWTASHSAGDINSINIPLSRSSSRSVLPFTPIRGINGQWSLNDSIDLNASLGKAGVYAGYDLSGFRSTGGQVSSAGAQVRLGRDPTTGSRLYGAVQVIDVRNQLINPLVDARQSSQSIYSAASWEGQLPWADNLSPGLAPPAERIGGLRLQGNLLHSNQSIDGQANGLWADASWRTERWRQSAGVFRFDPLLRWGEALLASDLQGAYWQADTATRQWQYGVTGELSDAVSNRKAASIYVSTYVRYRLDSKNAITTTVNLRALTNPASTARISWERQSVWGQTQWQSEVANINSLRTTRFGADHSLALTSPAALSASLLWERTTGNSTAPIQGWTWGLLGSVSPANRLVLDGSLRGSQRNDGSSAINANVALNWQLAQGWSLALRYTESCGQEAVTNLLASALTAAQLPQTLVSLPYQSLQLTLRYEGRAGASSRPLGGAVLEGAGSLSGVVFFDADNNGRREASEGGVPAVSVTLDSRYVTRTDAQGRYEFPYVAAKDHLIEISADNVPLPWSPLLREPVSVNVTVRANTVQDFAVQRDR